MNKVTIEEKEKDSVIKQELDKFINSFKSVIISSISKDGYGLASYSTITKVDESFYIYISKVSDHYQNIISNPDKISILFLEDEHSAKTILARKRATFRAEAIKIERDSKEFAKFATEFVAKFKEQSGAEQVITMRDFDLFRLKFGKCRYVKGFGGAYDIENSDVTMPQTKNPHKY